MFLKTCTTTNPRVRFKKTLFIRCFVRKYFTGFEYFEQRWRHNLSEYFKYLTWNLDIYK